MAEPTLGSTKEAILTFLLAFGYGVVSICFLFFLHKNILVANVPDQNTLVHWDSGLYRDIMYKGYTYDDPRINNTGHFLLFSLIWRWLHVGEVGICCVNYLFFAIGFTLLSRLYRLSTQQKMLWLSIPSLYMMMIPYTEATFFLLVSVTFYGIAKEKRWLIWVGLFLVSLTRASGILLLPAFLAMLVICNESKRKWYQVLATYCIDYLLPIVAATAFFVWYQYRATGVWFAYFIMQRKYQGHVFGMPILPFASYEGPRILWISAFAMFCCLLALIVFVVKAYIRYASNIAEPDKLLVVSLVYLVVTLYKTVFYNPTWGAGTTLTVGISRYVFATPFFFLFLHYFINRAAPYKPVHFLLVFILCNFVWLSCGSYVHIMQFLYFNFLTLIVFVYMLLPDKRYQWAPMAIMGMNLVLQVLMFQHYLKGFYLD